MKVPICDEHKDEIKRFVREFYAKIEGPFFEETLAYSTAGKKELQELAMERYPNARIALAKLEGVTEEMLSQWDVEYQEWLATKK